MSESSVELGPERKNFLGDCIVVAVESGAIAYWSERRHYHIAYEGGLISEASVEIREEGMEDWMKIDLNTVEAGILAVKSKEFRINKDIRSWILSADVLEDASDIDSVAADCLVQAALFGELRYG